MFERPSSARVAELCGWRNIARGIVYAMETEALIVATPWGILRAAPQRLQVGDAVDVAVRPDRVLLVRPDRDGGRRGTVLRCTLRDRLMLRRSLSAAIVVGTLLTAFNQGDLIVRGEFPLDLAWKVPLTYVVPFCVTTWGALINHRAG